MDGQPSADRFAARAAAVLFVLGVPAGAVNLAISSDVRAYVWWPQVLLFNLVLVILATAVWVMPWPRWPPRALLAIAVAGALLTVAADDTYGYTMSKAPIDGASVFIVIVSLWLGWTQAPRVPLLAGPLVCLPVLLYSGRVLGWPAMFPLLGLLVVCVGAAEALAWGRFHERASTASLRALVAVSARLDVTVADRDLPLLLAECARSALSANGAVVLDRAGQPLAAVGHYSGDSRPEPAVASAQRSVRKSRANTVVRLPLHTSGELVSIVVEIGRRTPSRVVEPAATLFSELIAHFLAERVAVRRRLRTDALTALGNRAAADDALDELTVGDSVAIFDIDHFKNVNDLLGHAGGDAVLRQVATFLQTQLRSTDTVCRHGGDEFLVVLRATPEPQLVVEAILRRWTIAEPLVTVSCGLATCLPNDTGAAVIERADQALYQAKRTGRARLHTSPEATR